MCNAWNHPPGCACGWGGEGHQGRRGRSNYNIVSESGYWWIPPIRRVYESYINPNARCPVCGDQVFFYQSPDEGRVFFNDLGPPWPKHPCTDNSSIPKEINATLHSRQPVTYQWQKDGWMPFFINVVTSVDNDFFKLTGTLDGERVILYIQKPFETITTDTIAQAKKIHESTYELSYVLPSMINKKADAFSVLWEARAQLDKSIKERKVRKRKQRNPKKKSCSILNSPEKQISSQKNSAPSNKNWPMTKPFKGHKKKLHLNNKKTSKTDKPEKETAMALAYAKALKEIKE